MLSHLAAFLAVAGISSVYAQGAVYSCNALSQPDYESCDRIFNSVDWDSGNGGQIVTNGLCAVFTDKGADGSIGNCEFQLCNFYPNGQIAYLLGWNIRAHYKIITDYCKPDDAGGQSPGEGGYEISYVENNPDTKPASRVARSAKRELNYTLMTIAEAAERRQRAANINAAKAIEKRADTWTNVAESFGVTRGTRDRLSAITDSGASATWSTTKGFSTSVSVSVEVSASFFEVFSASMSVTTTLEESISYTESLTFDPSGKCETEQSAVLYMYPLYDEYVGFWNDQSSDFVTILVPQKGENNYKIEVECLG